MKYGFILLIILLASCSSPSTKKGMDANTVALRMRLNQPVGQVEGIDSILCKHPFGSAGEIYFDDMVWQALSPETRVKTVECLDLKRHLRVRSPAPVDPPIRVWSARIDELSLKLYVGWLQSDCPACDLDEKTAQYRIRWENDRYMASEIPPEEIWR